MRWHDKSFFLILSSVLLFKNAHCDNGLYNTQLIPDSLKTNATAVVRAYNDDVVLEAKTVAEENILEAVTILTKGGENNSYFPIEYGVFSRVTDLSVVLFDSMGHQVKSYTVNDFNDVSLAQDELFLNSERLIPLKVSFPTYPYTVEIKYKLHYNGFQEFSWMPANKDESVQNGNFSFTTTADNPVHYKTYLINIVPVVTGNDEKKYEWTIKNFKAIRKEGNSYNWDDQAPYVMCAPNEFNLEGYDGKLTSWLELGKWVYQLYQGRQKLPADFVSKLNNMINSITDPKEKIKVLYKYLQSNTRYVAIEMGIGGWQPFEASFTAKKGYSDCKGLVNYMVAMLGACNITAYPVLVFAGDTAKDVDPDFTVNRFNHVILCAPL